MATEGSTKPTYSELEAENLRVRGLLQRIGELMSCTSWSDLSFRVQTQWIDMEIEVDKLLAGQGAESADIGKLDTVDKSELLPTQLPKAE